MKKLKLTNCINNGKKYLSLHCYFELECSGHILYCWSAQIYYSLSNWVENSICGQILNWINKTWEWNTYFFYYFAEYNSCTPSATIEYHTAFTFDMGRILSNGQTIVLLSWSIISYTNRCVSGISFILTSTGNFRFPWDV